MKILKYIIFISIFVSLFFLIYRESERRGFQKWWTSFRMAAVIAWSVAGFIPGTTEYISRNNETFSN